MSIKVRFDDNGWYHPSFGRLGRGKNLGKIYVLPDQFGEKETVKVPVVDHSSKPPRKVDEKTVTRYKYLPSSAEVFDDDEVEEMIEEAKYDSDAEAPVLEKPKQAEGGDSYLPGKGRANKAMGAQERTTGKAPAKKKPARRKKPAES